MRRSDQSPGWPLGTEYRITFHHPLTSEQLDQLTELNSLRRTVGVAFVDCQLSADQVHEAMAKLHGCSVYRVVAGQMSPLDDQSSAVFEVLAPIR